VSGASSGGFRLPRSLDVTLSNGLRLHAMEYRALPVVDFDLIVCAGAAHDPPGREGLADLTAELLRKGTARRTARELADAVDFVGGSLEGSADQDGTRMTGGFLSKDLDLALDLVAEMVMEPVFAQDEVERLKGETIAELQGVRENPGLLASRRFVDLLFHAHPYGHPSPGRESTVAAITRDDVRRFYEGHYRPDNVILVAAGDFDPDEFMAKAEARFGRWAPAGIGASAASRDLAGPQGLAGRSIYLIDKPDSTQSQIRMGGLGPPRTDPDYTRLSVANAIFGGGFTSRLVEEIRVNRGLSYGVTSRFYPLVRGGAFLISTFTKNATTRETIEVTLAVLGRFRDEGPTPEEMDKARRYLKGTFAIGHQSPGSLAEALADIAFYGLPRDYYDTYLDRLGAVTAADVRRVSSRFPYDDMVILVLGQASAVGQDLEALGPVGLLPLVER
jgi:zinc protease